MEIADVRHRAGTARQTSRRSVELIPWDGVRAMPLLSRSDAEDILFREARILDERRYREWLEMFGETSTYWMPCNGEGNDPTREISLIFDDRTKLNDRINRLESGVAHAQSPPSKTKRLISNVEIENAEDNAATVLSGFILYELRRGKERIFAGSYEHRLQFVDNKWKIASKKVVLINNDEVIDNLTFMV
jgi:3-phenylpropionate/cinnamic acid dioxygenase small subunit